MLFNSSINFIIYCFVGPKFRTTLRNNICSLSAGEHSRINLDDGDSLKCDNNNDDVNVEEDNTNDDVIEEEEAAL